MRPRLVTIRGPLAPRVFELGDPPLLIGRERTCAVQLQEAHVSRRHCQIERDGSRWVVRDLGSTRGTTVNEAPISRHVLSPGDEIAVCDSGFLFLVDDNDPSVVEPEAPDYRNTLELSVESGADHNPARLVEALESSRQALETLVSLGSNLGSYRSLEELARGVLELVLDAIPCELAGTSFLDDPTEPGPSYELHCDGRLVVHDGGPEAIGISATVWRRVRSARVGVVARPGRSGDAELDHTLDHARSLHDRRVSALVCAPMLDREDRVVGVIYADAEAEEADFAEDHLRLLSAIAGVASSALPNLRRLEWLDGERRRLHESQLRHEMVASSPPMDELLRAIARVAATDSTVLIRGESGTGKELVASTIHLNGPRADAPFVAINCANLADTLLESEIFGYERGAFTGADQRHRGRLEHAHTGTLFLDEVAELSPAVQAKLLRVLQERSFERLGGHRTIPVDVRLVAATNRDLEAAMRAGTFRADLYYRLQVIELVVPPLRERRGDVRLLAQHFTALHCNRLNRPVMTLDPAAIACLESYSWPGNVRELSNAIERAVVLGDSDVIRAHDLPEDVREVAGPAGAGATTETGTGYHEAIRRAKVQVIVTALTEAGGNVTRAAAALGLHPNYLHRLIGNLGIRETLGDLRDGAAD